MVQLSLNKNINIQLKKVYQQFVYKNRITVIFSETSEHIYILCFIMLAMIK